MSAWGNAWGAAFGSTFGSIGSIAPQRYVNRGDDGGERERFWQRKADEWLEEYIKRIPALKTKPKQARIDALEKFQSEQYDYEIPQVKIDIVERILIGLVKDVSYSLDGLHDLITAINKRKRRRREYEMIMLIAGQA